MDNLITPILRAGYDVVCFLATEVNSTSARQGLLEWYKLFMSAKQQKDAMKRGFAALRNTGIRRGCNTWQMRVEEICPGIQPNLH